VVAGGPDSARLIADPTNPRLTARDDNANLLASDKHADTLQALLDGDRSGVVGKKVNAYSAMELFGALAAGHHPGEGRPPPEWVFLGDTVSRHPRLRTRGPGPSP
jgi:hypothetical protein